MQMPDQKTILQAEMLANRLRKKIKHLSKWARRTGTGAFRLYDRDIPEIPLALDYYGESLPDGAALAGALYQRPYEKDEAEEEAWLGVMRNAAASAVEIDPCNVFIKLRRRQQGNSQYEKNSSAGVIRHVSEGGLRFRVNLSDYLDTGLFLDRRLMRALVRGEAAGKKVLNLFCYTASFSVYAAAGGAAQTCSVDLSNTYLNWAQENFALNGFTASIAGRDDFPAYPQAHRLVRADALSFLSQARAAKHTWDHIILDPPAFSNSKKMNGTLDLKRDHLELISSSLALLASGGKLWFSANVKGFTANAAELEASLKPRFPGVKVTDIKNKITDEDFRGRKIPQSYVIELVR